MGQKELINKTLEDIESDHYIKFTTPEYADKGDGAIECSFSILDGESIIEKFYLVFNANDSDEYIKGNLIDNLIVTLLASASTYNVTDQEFKDVFDSKFAREDLSKTYDLADYYDSRQATIHELGQMAYELSNKRAREKKALPSERLTKPSHKIASYYLAKQFKNWCQKWWLSNNSQFAMLDYPERACLSLNNINDFAVDENVLPDNDHWNSNLIKLQNKIMKGLGVKRD